MFIKVLIYNNYILLSCGRAFQQIYWIGMTANLLDGSANAVVKKAIR